MTLYFDFDVAAAVRDIDARRHRVGLKPPAHREVSQVSHVFEVVSPDPAGDAERLPSAEALDIAAPSSRRTGRRAELSQESPLSPPPAPRATPAAVLTLEQVELYEERAAILEFDEGLTRAEAERLALSRVLAARRHA
jgi:hypothetical protein